LYKRVNRESEHRQGRGTLRRSGARSRGQERREGPQKKGNTNKDNLGVGGGKIINEVLDG